MIAIVVVIVLAPVLDQETVIDLTLTHLLAIVIHRALTHARSTTEQEAVAAIAIVVDAAGRESVEVVMTIEIEVLSELKERKEKRMINVCCPQNFRLLSFAFLPRSGSFPRFCLSQFTITICFSRFLPFSRVVYGVQESERQLRTLFVGNMPLKAAEKDIAEFFGGLGCKVREVQLVRDKNKKSKGFVLL